VYQFEHHTAKEPIEGHDEVNRIRNGIDTQESRRLFQVQLVRLFAAQFGLGMEIVPCCVDLALQHQWIHTSE
jgi:hypothetical protein